MSSNLYYLALYFLFYSVLGWMTEEVFALVKHGKLVNRGFLKGPVCPVYGFGMIIIIVCLTPIRDNQFVLFIGSALLTTLLEFITGYILEKLFNTKWWDYSEEHFNVKGYICLKFTILWGLAVVFVMDIVHPAAERLAEKLPYRYGCIIIAAAYAILAFDLVTTIISVADLRKGIRKLEEMSEKADEFKAKIAELAAESSELIEERREELRSELALQHEQIIIARRSLSEDIRNRHSRFFTAFPHFTRNGHIAHLKARMEERMEEKRH